MLTACTSPAETAANSADALAGTTSAHQKFHGSVPFREYPLPHVELTDSQGKLFAVPENLPKKSATLVFFGYAHCPDACGTVLADFAAAFRKLPFSVRQKAQFVFITADPARDNPQAIRAYLDRFDPAFIGLTGDRRKIAELAEAVGVAIAGQSTLRDGGYQVAHGAQVLGFRADRHGRLTAHVFWEPGTPIGSLEHDIRLLTKGPT